MSSSREALRPRRVFAPASRVVIAGLMVLGLTAAIAGGAGASRITSHHRNAPGGRPVAAGTVTSAPADNAFSITTRSGASLSVEVDGSTTYVELGVASPSLDDVTQNALVAIFGSIAGTTVSATEVNIWVPRNAGAGANAKSVAAGVVTTSPSDNSFTISTRSGGTVSIVVSATTTYAERGVASPTLDEVSQGELVAVFGTMSDGTVMATEVVIRPSRQNGRYAMAGTIESTPSSTGFTITTFNGQSVAVVVTSSTTYFERGVPGIALDDLSPGELVGVFGTMSDGTETATEIVVCQPRMSRDYATAGTVQAAPTSSGFTVMTFNGTTVTVDVTGTTTYAEYGVSNPTIADVTPGEFVGVFGTTVGTTVTASEVVIAGNQRQGLFGFGHRLRFGHRSGGFGGFGFGRGRGGPDHRPLRAGATGASGQGAAGPGQGLGGGSSS
ncbi:MAG: hypothetical protein WB383_02650 [Acidimicrobiales bacterium]